MTDGTLQSGVNYTAAVISHKEVYDLSAALSEVATRHIDHMRPSLDCRSAHMSPSGTGIPVSRFSHRNPVGMAVNIVDGNGMRIAVRKREQTGIKFHFCRLPSCAVIVANFTSLRLRSELSSAIDVYVFTALHVMQTRYCEEISFRPSVRLSVCHTRGL